MNNKAILAALLATATLLALVQLTLGQQSCINYQGCIPCTRNGCTWCGRSDDNRDGQCRVSTSSCPANWGTYSRENQCRNDAPAPTPTPNPPADRCTNFQGCIPCTRNGCTWCGRTADNRDGNCRASNSNCPANFGRYQQENQCRTDAPVNPTPNPPADRCTNFQGCIPCTRNGCTWCGRTADNRDGNCRASNSNCPANFGRYQQENQCRTDAPLDNRCNTHQGCVACTQNGCNWCTDNSNNRQGYCHARNSGTCGRTFQDFSNPQQCRIDNNPVCNRFNTCLTCAINPQCAWCTGTNRCIGNNDVCLRGRRAFGILQCFLA